MKDGESPFSECANPKSTAKVEQKFDEASWCNLKENDVFPVHKEKLSKFTKVPPPGFVASSKGSLQEETDLPTPVIDLIPMRTS